MKTLTCPRQPDFGRFLTAIRRGQPDVVPFIELIVDDTVIERVLEEPLVPAGTPEGQVWDVYTRNRMRCLAGLGYDHYESGAGIAFRREAVTGEDTAIYSRGERAWQDENRGAIET
jgi:hypothetical protein